MGAALELVSGTVTAPGAVLTALTMAAGNSAQIRSANMSSRISLLNAWAFNNVAGEFVIKSPRLHDNVQGIRMRVRAANTDILYPSVGSAGFAQPLISQDILTLLLSGSGVAGNIEDASFLVYYADLPGVQGRFITGDLLQKNGVNDMGQEVSITTTVNPGYSGQVAINSLFDNFKANTDYALLGYIVDTQAGSLRIQGVDVGNLGIGGPCNPALRHVTANWFTQLSEAFKLPLIPVFNSQNKSAILVDALGNQGALTILSNFHFIELKPGTAPQSVSV